MTQRSLADPSCAPLLGLWSDSNLISERETAESDFEDEAGGFRVAEPQPINRMVRPGSFGKVVPHRSLSRNVQ